VALNLVGQTFILEPVLELPAQKQASFELCWFCVNHMTTNDQECPFAHGFETDKNVCSPNNQPLFLALPGVPGEGIGAATSLNRNSAVTNIIDSLQKIC